MNFALSHVAALAFLVACVAWIARVDLRQTRIPNLANALLALGGLVQLALTDPASLNPNTIAAGIVLVFFWGASHIAWRRRGQEMLGLGDVKLLGSSTIWVGPMGIAWVILLASLGGIIFVGLTHLTRGSEPGRKVPFGPFLGVATILVWLYGTF